MGRVSQPGERLLPDEAGREDVVVMVRRWWRRLLAKISIIMSALWNQIDLDHFGSFFIG
jgi:hypothetical protein